MRTLSFLLAGTALLAATPAEADTVREWISFGEAIARAAAPPPDAPRTGEHDQAATQLAIAMFEALNAIDRRYETFLGMPQGDVTASQDAAAATAASQVLLAHTPGQKAALDESYGMTMLGIADAGAREKGKAIGQAGAKLALAAGAMDTTMPQVPYRPRTSPGVWTAANLPVIQPYVATFKPWVLPSYDAVRPGPPPKLDSARWARDLAEVQAIGAKTSKTRTPDQSLMAKYRITPDMMPSMRMIADQHGRPLVQNARMFALAAIALDDAYRATSMAKLHYNFWRPITAIRNAEDDGNAATKPDAGWEPLIATPNHPEYPCGHCTYAAATATVLKSEVGDTPPGGVRVASRSVPNSAVQVMPSFDEWVKQVSYSRILGGVHYRFSNAAGEEVGRKTAELVLAKIMRPLPAQVAAK